MQSTEQLEGHYGRGGILPSILRALQAMGKDLSRIAPADLAPVDEFHIRGREATVDLAQRARAAPGLRVLDVGSGLGGSARYLAATHGCRVTGVDVTAEYVEAARELAERAGLGGAVSFRQASALNLPFEDRSFDLAWTEHVQMNVADKRRFYEEIARVLNAGGRLAFHDVFQGAAGPVHFPVPWADHPALSFLVSPGEARSILESIGFRVVEWEDETEASAAWFGAVAERIRGSGLPPLGIHLLMGDTAATKIENQARNLAEGRVRTVQAVLQRPNDT